MTEQQPTPEPAEGPTVIPPQTAAAYGKSVSHFFANEITTVQNLLKQTGEPDDSPPARSLQTMVTMVNSFSNAETVSIRKLSGGGDEKEDYGVTFTGERPLPPAQPGDVPVPSKLVAQLFTAIEDRFGNSSGTIGVFAETVGDENLKSAAAAFRTRLEAFRRINSIRVITDESGNDEFIFTKAEETTSQ